MNNRSTLRLFALSAGTLLAAAAFAGEPGAPCRGEPGARPDPLAGPAVENQANPEARRRFAPRERHHHAPPEMVGFGRPDSVMLNVIREMSAPDAPEDLRLSDEQRRAVRTALTGYHAELKAYMDEHREELRELGIIPPEKLRAKHAERMRAAREKQAGDERGPAPEKGEVRRRGPRAEGAPEVGPRRRGNAEGRPQHERPRPPRLDEAGRARVKEIMEGAPKPDAYLPQVVEVLNARQQEELRWRLARALEDPQGAAEDARRERRERASEIRRQRQAERKPAEQAPARVD